jgi:chorismate synthase
MSINATKGFELGSGFAGASMRGSQHNDAFVANSEHITATNRSGGIQGGISNGEDIYFSVAFKPVATIMQKQDTIDNQGNAAEITAQGRHDPCVVPRAVPIVEAMAALTLVDHLLRYKAIQK